MHSRHHQSFGAARIPSCILAIRSPHHALQALRALRRSHALEVGTANQELEQLQHAVATELEPILQELNVRVPFTVEAESMWGTWQSFSPYIVMRGLRLSFPEQDLPPLAFSEGRIRIDVLNSLRTSALQVRRAT